MRPIKIVGWVLASFVALLAIAVAWLLLWFNPNQYKPDIEKLVKDKTGRALSLQGDLKLSFWPSLAVELGKTTLGNAPGYGDAPMLSVNQVRLGVKVLPLLHKQVEVGAIELDAPTVSLVKKSDTENNWSDLSKQETSESTSPEVASSGGALNVSIERIDIKNANLSYDDRVAHTQTQLKDFSLTTGKLEPGKPVSLESGFVMEQVAADKSKQSIAMKLVTRVDADMDAQRYTLNQSTIDVQLTRNGGKPIPLKLTADVVRADLKAQTVELSKLALASGELKLDADIKGEKIVDAPEFSGALNLAPVSLRNLAKQFDVSLPVTRDPKVLSQLGMQTQFKATTKSAELSALTMKLDDTTLKGKLAITDFERKAMRFDLDVDRINVDRYLSPSEEKPQTQAADSGPVKIPGDAVRGLDIVGELRMAEAVMSKVQLGKVKLGVDARNDKLHLSPVQASVYQGQFNGDVLLDASGKVPRVALTEQVSGVNFAPLFKALYDTDKISGRGNVNLKVAGSGVDSDALKKTLSGTVSFNVDEGAYEGIDLWWEIRRARALLRQQPIPAASAKPRTPFTALHGTGVMTNGVFSNQDLNAAVQYLKVTGQGSADLVKSSIDYRLQAAVLKFPSEAKLASGAQDTGEDLVGLTIPIAVTGSLTDPKVRPDVNALLKERAKQELQKQKEKVEEKLKDQLKDKLRGLFGG